jgi:hypothetical protein
VEHSRKLLIKVVEHEGGPQWNEEKQFTLVTVYPHDHKKIWTWIYAHDHSNGAGRVSSINQLINESRA